MHIVDRSYVRVRVSYVWYNNRDMKTGILSWFQNDSGFVVNQTTLANISTRHEKFASLGRVCDIRDLNGA